ncbi:hypothetical protein SODALDRAFT_326308 [Sodiomyces alkalinus F11]|uniref:Uncharacterized protein n=1 Tax=Sodiomyces alkalinus (strain CBS 110278 / VKM F-3762 / F11) TaxID=1314773 RepID=A0A3N2Q5T7_SODAK|nr:hypothetical protein SODALDRAFT_326308 [Sodiomyces alkalinus F11]ROT42143.1 hypothetical protein SODALDRAFT_326308 [Sodiomyces alkalinus F11]
MERLAPAGVEKPAHPDSSNSPRHNHHQDHGTVRTASFLFHKVSREPYLPRFPKPPASSRLPRYNPYACCDTSFPGPYQFTFPTK